MVLCAAELPLESLCKVKDIFVVPGSLTSTKGRGGGEHFIYQNERLFYWCHNLKTVCIYLGNTIIQLNSSLYPFMCIYFNVPCRYVTQMNDELKLRKHIHFRYDKMLHRIELNTCENILDMDEKKIRDFKRGSLSLRIIWLWGMGPPGGEGVIWQLQFLM
jgi:hypothetical protein